MLTETSIFPGLTCIAEPPSCIFCVEEISAYFHELSAHPTEGQSQGKGVVVVGVSVTGLGCPNVITRKPVMREKAKGQKHTGSEKKNAGYTLVLR